MVQREYILAWLAGSLLCLAPPAAGAVTPRRTVSTLAAVPELAKPVTYTETKIPLGELVEKVANDTGVPLTAAVDVADEPVAVVVKDLPARELLEQLAHLLDYQWSRRLQRAARPDTQHSTPNTPTPQHPNTSTPRYEIWQDLAGKQREQELRDAQSAEAEKRLRHQVEQYVEIAALSPEQIQALREAWENDIERKNKLRQTLSREQYLALVNSPEERERSRRFQIASWLSSPITRALASLLGRLTSQQWAALRRDGEITFSSDPLPGERPLPAEIVGIFRASQPRARPPRLRTDPPPDPRNEEWDRRHEKELQEQWAAASGYRVLIRLSAEPRNPHAVGSLRLDAFATPFRTGRPFPTDLWKRGPAPQIYLSDAAEAPARAEEARSPEERAALEKDPVLGAKQSFKPDPKPRLNFSGRFSSEERQLPELLPDLARAYGVDFIADAYWNAPLTYVRQFPAGEPVALFALLDRFAGSYHRWDRRGRLICLRSRTWFLDRRREIPLRLVRRWQELCARHGALPLDEYLSITATLSEDQMESLQGLIGERMFPSDLQDLWVVYEARHALRLYASLTPAQRQALWQGAALGVSQLTPPQRGLFVASLKAIRRYHPAPLDLTHLAAGSFSLSAVSFVRIREQRAGSTRYRLEPAAAHPAQGPVPPASPGKQPAPPASQAGAAPTITLEAATRHPVLQIELRCQYGPELRETISMIVASQP